MSERDELRELWETQPPTEKRSGEEVMQAVMNRMVKFDRTIARRNLIETIAAAAVILFFGYMAVRSSNGLARAGCIVIGASAAWIVYYLRKYGQAGLTPDPSQNLEGYSRALLERYDRQIQLLKSVKYWYLLPMYIGLLLFSAGFSLERIRTATLSWADFVGPALFTVIFAVIWWLNEVKAVGHLRALRARLAPQDVSKDSLSPGDLPSRG